jgi:integrase
MTKRGFGNIRKLPSGRYQARYLGLGRVTVTAPTTFGTKSDAEGWLSTERRRVEDSETWLPPKQRIAAERAAAKASALPTFSEYATQWIAGRKVKGHPLAHRTRVQYAEALEDYLSPTFGEVPIDQITPQAVNAWYDAFTPKSRRGRKSGGGTTRARVYGFGRAVMNTAVSANGPLAGKVNPFAVRGGGSAPRRARDEHVATSEQLAVMLDTIRPEWRPIILIATWCGLRYSEIVELRRGDIDLTKQIIKVRRAVSGEGNGGVKAPKSDAGIRDMNIPSHIVGDLREHLRGVGRSGNAPLFPGKGGGHLMPVTFYGVQYVKRKTGGRIRSVRETYPGGWYAARDAAGIPMFHFHDLRATGATLMAQLGATEAEIQAFLGDSTPQAAQRYVRAARSRMKGFADKMSELAKAGGW